MNVRVAILLVGLALVCTAAKAQAADANRHVSVWIIPPEESGPNDIAQGEDIPARMEQLRLELAGTRVRLLNVEEPLATKTASWYPEYTVQNFQIVANQTATFAALARFAAQNNVDVVLRLITWVEAFALLRAGRTTGPDALPDVIEVGTTWTADLAAQGKIRSKPDWQRDRGNWRDVLGVPACALPYALDVRVLYYWKRLPSAAPDSRALTLNDTSWPAILDSVGSNTSSADTVAIPTGVTLNLLYDYLSLVRAGGTQTIIHNGMFGPRVFLSSDSALSVPIYLAEHSSVRQSNGVVRRLISYPETTHEEVTRTFVNGGYRVSLETVSFLSRWAKDFYERQKREGKTQRFWDYAAAAVPPGGFKGGGELVVLSQASDAELAFKLADYLTTDPEYTEMLAQAGFLPPGRPDYGLDMLAASFVKDERDARDVRILRDVARKAIDQGYRYPDFQRWPDVFENRAVLEKVQRVWRRMAESDVAGVRQAAKDVDWEINSQIYLPSRALNALIQSWRWIALIVCMAAILAAVMALHRRRLRQLDMRLQERVNERTRIARELHDTLLQSLHGLLFQFQAARNMFPRSPENAIKGLDDAIVGTEQAIAESRDAIHDLRSQLVAQGDLARSLKAVGEELLAGHDTNHGSPTFDVLVEGEPQKLCLAIQREVYSIARELIRNGFHHANAQSIEVEIRYGKNQFRTRVRDDGKGIDSKVLEESRRPGHWGLPGIRERAQQIGSQLDFWSQPGAGTEAELTVPAALAYEKAVDGSKAKHFSQGGNS